MAYARQAVLSFARTMEARLKANDYKGGWSGCDAQWLWHRAFAEMLELRDALQDKKPKSIANEAADAANFLMMVSNLYGEGSG